MKSLVTGGAGFIGSNLVDALLARGDEVTVVDDLSTGRRSNLDGALAAGAELVELDIRDAAALAALAGERRPETVFHLAAQIDVRKSLEDPAFDAAVNVGGTANVLDAARAAEAAAGSSSSPPAAPSTARARDSSCRSTRGRRSRRCPPTARASSRPRATWRCTSGSTGSPASRCGSATSTARARTRSARRA